MIFLTVMNTLSDTLSTRVDLGYTLPPSQSSSLSISTNHLLYADDVCLVSNTPAGCQHLLDLVERWLQWALLNAKLPKCRTLCFQASTGRKVDPSLSLGGMMIRNLGGEAFKFLGMPVRIYTNTNDARVKVREDLERMLKAVDRSPVTRHQKLRLYKLAICPRLSWALTVEEFPTTWLEHCLQPLATSYLKRWAGLARSANTGILFLPAKRGGLALPSLTTIHKKQQSSRMAQFLTSQDPGVLRAAHLRIQEEEKAQRVTFKPATLVKQLRAQEPSRSRQALARAAKSLLAEEDDERRSEHLHSLPAQGLMSRCWGQKSPQLWVVAVEGLPPEPLKFTLNAVLDTLPTNSNLCRWGKKSHDTCPLCSSRQSLSHVMNNCPTAMNLRRYSRRHDKVLEVLGGFIQEHLSPSFGFTIDLPSSVYSFPQHITPTDSRPDIVWWCEGSRSLWLLELTVSFEPQMEDAQQRKQSKYQDLVEASRDAGYTTELITVEVGSRGLVDASSFRPLARVLNVSHKDISNLCIALIRTTLLESHKIWCSRNVCI